MFAPSPFKTDEKPAALHSTTLNYMDDLTSEHITPNQVGSTVGDGEDQHLEEAACCDAPIPINSCKTPITTPESNAPSKGRKKRSWLWAHFEEIIKDGEIRAQCTYCKGDVCGNSKSGTTVMKNHLVRCKRYPPNIDMSQTLLSLSQSEQINACVDDNVVGKKSRKLECWKFKQDESPKAFVPTKGKKKRSWLWGHFEEIIKNEEIRAQCTYCKVDVCGSSKSGTTVMKNHLIRCKEYPPNLDMSQTLLSLSQSEQTNASVDDNVVEEKNEKLEHWKFKQEESQKAFAKMILMDELPFRFVEREGFRHFMSIAQPNFVFPSRWMVARDCYNVYIEEKKSLRSCFSMCCSRISLTIDTWTSCQDLTYVCLTAHFIDQSWKLHKKILNFCQINGHSGDVIGEVVEKCLLDWGITRVLTITVDNASSNDVRVEYLRKRLQRWKDGTILDGKFVHMRCAAHILNLTVRDSLEECNDSISRVRNAVRYVIASPTRMQKFSNCAKQEQIESKHHLCLDVETRWNSTYLMLEYALIYRKAFNLLEISDGGEYKAELTKSLGVPNDNDWDCIKAFVPFLKIFYDATLRLSGSLYCTTNVYLQELVTIGKMIKTKCESSDVNERLMAYSMKKKHEKYWENVDNINLLLYVAVVLDPRRKMQYVRWAINDQYDPLKALELNNKVKDTLHSLYEHYTSQQPYNVPNLYESDTTSKEMESFEDWHDMVEAEFERDVGDQTMSERKSDLNKYLDEKRELNTGRNFDVLGWWKKREDSYPTLALMARDVLAIPVSTIASESAFSTSSRVLDPFRSSLPPKMVEALICGQDWLRTSHGPLLLEETLEDIEKIGEDIGERPGFGVSGDVESANCMVW
ncbi:Zinc finger BED domain-containing protein RICESLEEPER 2 [Bienertia sinuspersici]